MEMIEDEVDAGKMILLGNLEDDLLWEDCDVVQRLKKEQEEELDPCSLEVVVVAILEDH
jgi:hypothetical protein